MGYSQSIKVGGQNPFPPHFVLMVLITKLQYPIELTDKETFSQPVYYKPAG